MVSCHFNNVISTWTTPLQGGYGYLHCINEEIESQRVCVAAQSDTGDHFQSHECNPGLADLEIHALWIIP